MITLRITTDCIVSGRHATAGDIVTVNPQEAALLLGLDRATRAPSPPAIEQATATPVSEQAVAPRQRAARPKNPDPKP